MGTKLIVTLVCNLIAALVLARVIHQLHGVDLLRGLKIGAGVGLGFCATALAMTYVWQSPPRRLWAIDTGYHIVGCLLWAPFCRCGASLLTVIGVVGRNPVR